MGKNIHIYLMDGTADGRIKCTMPGRTITAFKIPRPLLGRCGDIDLLRQYGVYFMLGEEEVYVGQAQGCLSRIMAPHHWDEWAEVIVFVASDDRLGPTEVCYLENRFYLLARDAKRYRVRNGNTPSPGNTTEEKESELEDFVGQVRLLMGILGHNCLEPYVRRRTAGSAEPAGKETKERKEDGEDGGAEEAGQMLFCSRKNRATGFVCEGKCVQTNEGYVVLRGSRISPDANDSSLSPRVVSLRRTASIGKDRVLREDVLFGAPSSAASFVIGNSANGWIEWKDESGHTLKETMERGTEEKAEDRKENGEEDRKRGGAEGIMAEGEILRCIKKNRATGFVSEGKCVQTDEGYVVLRGSRISPDANDSNLSSEVVSLRGTASIGEDRILREDVLFKTPSAAASFVTGNSADGWTAWKDESGRTLKETKECGTEK